MNFYIFFNGTIYKSFRMGHHFSGQFSVQVDRGGIFPHVKAYIVEAVFPQDDAGENMFATVGLHMRKTDVPVDRAIHNRTNFQCSVTVVGDDASFF